MQQQKERGATPLLKRLQNPSQKIEWALKLLLDKGHRVGTQIEGSDAKMRFEVDGEMMSVPEIYALVTKYPEWNDRLGLGTARLRRLK